MKKGYKKLLMFETVIFLILILNSFFINILGNYATVFFLVIALIIFKMFFGFERDRHRYTTDIIFDTVIFLLFFFLLYYLFGIVIGFAKAGKYYNISGITKFIIPIILTTITKEYLRYQLITKSEGNKLLIVVSCLLFIFLDITNPIYYNNFNSKYNIFIFVALTFLPAVSSNFVCSYITSKAGYKPNILYLLAIGLYQYLLPIIPNPNEYLSSLVGFLLPIAWNYKLNRFFKATLDEEIERTYNKKSISSLVIPTIVVIVLVYFTSGYFRYYAVAIASGSMEKAISKGDVVIVEKIDKDYQSLKKGQIIAYKHSGIIVVHRLTKIVKDEGEYYFYTKGDANKEQDNYVIAQEEIMGTVNFKIPFIGLPTVWLNEL